MFLKIHILICGLIISSTGVPYVEMNAANNSDINGYIRAGFCKILYLTTNTVFQPYIQIGGNTSKNI